MHLTPDCTALSRVAVNEIKEFGDNERDISIRCCRLDNSIEKIEKLDINKKLIITEERITKLVEQKKKEKAQKLIFEKIEQTYASVVSMDNFSTTINMTKSQAKRKKITTSRNFFRVQGIKKDSNKSKAENLFPTHEELNGIIHQIGARTEINESKRLGKFNPEQRKHRTLL